MRISTLSSAALLVALALGPSACKSQQEFHRATRAVTQRDAGSVHVTVLAVAPWSHYLDALQPRFQLTADQARDLVIRDTRQQFESNQSGVSLGASANQSPDSTGLPTGPDKMLNSNFAALPDRVEGPDAMMEYWTANGLYQEVQIMNRIMRDAVIPEGFRPYLVRLQISLIPRRRHQPYDAYTTLSFFSPDPAASTASEALATGALAAAPETSLRVADTSKTSTGGTGPVVLPLLVTDNLEASLQHRSSQDVQRLALSLLALPGDFATKISADLFSQEFQGEVAGRDLNALLTVARMSQNTLRVRIGAMAESTADYAMVPRNHNVTLLLMVPEKSAADVELVSRTTLVDTDTGDELSESTSEDVAQSLGKIGARYGLEGLDEKSLMELFRFAQANDQVGFRARLVERMGADHSAVRLSQSLWIELVSLMGGSQFASGRFHLPGHGEKDLLSNSFYEQTLVVIDYYAKGQGCETLVRNATIPEGAKLQGTLSLQSAGQTVSLPAEVVDYDAEVAAVRLRFPSLYALGLDDEALVEGNLRMSLRIGGDEKPASFSAIYLPPPPPAPVYQPPGAILPPGAVLTPPGGPTPGGPNVGGPTPGGVNTGAVPPR